MWLYFPLAPLQSTVSKLLLAYVVLKSSVSNCPYIVYNEYSIITLKKVEHVFRIPLVVGGVSRLDRNCHQLLPLHIFVSFSLPTLAVATVNNKRCSTVASSVRAGRGGGGIRVLSRVGCSAGSLSSLCCGPCSSGTSLRSTCLLRRLPVRPRRRPPPTFRPRRGGTRAWRRAKFGLNLS